MVKQIVILLYFMAVASLVLGQRTRRSVVFTKNSKFFFRLNGKDNVIPWNQIFAHGWAFRVNYDLPESFHKRRVFFKRDLTQELEMLDLFQDRAPIFSCFMKDLCGWMYRIEAGENCKFFCNIGKIINRSIGDGANFFKNIYGKCEYYVDMCNDSLQ